MRIRKIILFVGISVVMIGSCDAATKCVALNSSTTCTGTASAGTLDWSATCTTDGNSIAISGVAGCSSGHSYNPGTKSDTLKTSSVASANTNCWCKMTSPAVSSWVFVMEHNPEADPSIEECNYICANTCANFLQLNEVRSALFSGLGD